jgi:pyruvate ferredoxin oxidoreductase beta subunit
VMRATKGSAGRAGGQPPAPPEASEASGAMIAVNATGCLEVFSTPFPETSCRAGRTTARSRTTAHRGAP